MVVFTQERTVVYLLTRPVGKSYGRMVYSYSFFVMQTTWTIFEAFSIRIETTKQGQYIENDEYLSPGRESGPETLSCRVRRPTVPPERRGIHPLRRPACSQCSPDPTCRTAGS